MGWPSIVSKSAAAVAGALRGRSRLLAFALLLWPTEAQAGSFFDDGSFAFDPNATVTFDFEEGVPEPVDPEQEPIVRVESDSALSGRWVIELGEHGQAYIPLQLPPLARRYQVSLWIRGGDGVGSFVVGADDRVDEIATLYPTGRVTSDGWVELANDELRIDGARFGATAGLFSPEGCELDAIEVVAQGAIDGEVNPSCNGAVDGAACGTGQVCYWSECRNVDGWVPPIPDDRQDVTAYLENRLRFLFGPFRERTLDLPNALLAIEAMRHATDRWTYWNSFTLAVRRLHDGHTSTSSMGTRTYDTYNPRPLALCFLEGDADLSQGTEPSDPFYRDIVVSHVGGDHNLGLKPGDRLVRVDGLHPVAWSRSLIVHNWRQPAVSNHATFAEHASELGGLVSRFAHEIEIIRCDAQAKTCGAVETINLSDIPYDEVGTPFDHVRCDNRPLRHVPGAPPSHAGEYYDVFSGLLNESNPTERIYGVEWESLSTMNGQDGMGAALSGAVQSLNDEAAAAVIFDHRTGTGGTLVGPAIIWNFAVQKHPISLMSTRQRAEDEQPSLTEGQAIFNQALAQGWVDVAGSSFPTTMPVALLITEDVSASDWLPLGMKDAGTNVRIFGPYQTNGGFSTRFILGYWLGINYVLASGDTFLPDGSTANGRGVEPDVVVLPRQSDLLAGKDTVFEAALSWVRQELGQ